jgi:hypothetical protein
MKLIKVVFLKFRSIAKQVLKIKTHFYRCFIEMQMLSHLAACPFRPDRVCAKFYRLISIQSAKRTLNDVFAIRFSNTENDYFLKNICHSDFVSGVEGG